MIKMIKSFSDAKFDLYYKLAKDYDNYLGYGFNAKEKLRIGKDEYLKMIDEYVKGNLNRAFIKAKFPRLMIVNPKGFEVVRNVINFYSKNNQLTELERAYKYKKTKRLYGIAFKKNEKDNKIYAFTFMGKENLKNIYKKMKSHKSYETMYNELEKFICKEVSLTGKKYKTEKIKYYDKKIKIINKNPIICSI
jgi:hypothetical protein